LAVDYTGAIMCFLYGWFLSYRGRCTYVISDLMPSEMTHRLLIMSCITNWSDLPAQFIDGFVLSAKAIEAETLSLIW